MLNNFDINKQIVIQCDSFKDALGCYLLQDGNPVAYASKSLTETENNYSYIKKELFFITFLFSKFYNHVYGNKIVINNDYLPLVSLIKKNL